MVETNGNGQDNGSQENESKWVDCKSMMEILGVSKSTLYRKIDLNEVESAKIGNARLFKVSGDIDGKHQTHNVLDFENNGNTSIEVDSDSVDSHSRKYVEKLEEEVIYLRSRLEKLENELSETKQRSDTIVLRFTENFENQKLIGNVDKPFWRFW